MADNEAGRTLTSAWIETDIWIRLSRFGTVALSRVRGLKQLYDKRHILFISRTLTSAWIETICLGYAGDCSPVALSRVRGLKPAGHLQGKPGNSRTLTSAWIETGRRGRPPGSLYVAL